MSEFFVFFVFLRFFEPRGGGLWQMSLFDIDIFDQFMANVKTLHDIAIDQIVANVP